MGRPPLEAGNCPSQQKPGLTGSPGLTDVAADTLDIAVQLLPLLPQMLDQSTHPRGQILFGVFQDGGHLIAQLRRSFGERNATLQQETSDLVDHRCPTMYEPVAHPGFRSRWITPSRCAASRPSAICAPMCMTSFSGSGPAAIRAPFGVKSEVCAQSS
jgi:hypothetical protein